MDAEYRKCTLKMDPNRHEEREKMFKDSILIHYLCVLNRIKSRWGVLLRLASVESRNITWELFQNEVSGW